MEGPAVPWSEDRYVTANGIRTRYRSAGEGGVPLILLHGLSGTLEDWSETVAALSRARRVIALDLLGSGKTDKPPECSYAPDLMRDHVIGVIDALSLDVVDLDGWSLGGRIALDVAHAAPDRVRRLVLTAPAGLGPDTFLDLDAPFSVVLGQALLRPSASGLRIMGNALRNGNGDRLLRFAARRLYLLKDGGARQGFLGQLESLVGRHGFLPGPRRALLAKLPRIETPTLAIWGRQDNFSPFAHSGNLRKLMPNCRLHVVERCGHAPQIEWPEIYTAAIEDFLA
ncbi:alpha/beta fold hydrolase [Salipiger sp. IMCC34102]|uniref:alpha/beta fold hydrolase n=1 Tax=Salipiger sp. IMCC34102 TaxID=2510647 RepID=UPI00101DA1C2|nr:alpha/beta fold hydrolase [Salipiger sp. IMCC34102]RYH01111.1 alpha/beta fold hydrolase [Salipiger sp. IMCC34102]